MHVSIYDGMNAPSAVLLHLGQPSAMGEETSATMERQIVSRPGRGNSSKYWFKGRPVACIGRKMQQPHRSTIEGS